MLLFIIWIFVAGTFAGFVFSSKRSWFIEKPFYHSETELLSPTIVLLLLASVFWPILVPASIAWFTGVRLANNFTKLSNDEEKN